MCWREVVPSCCWSLWPWWWYFAAIGTTGRPRRPVIITQWCTTAASIQISKVTKTATRTKTSAIIWSTPPTKTTCTQALGRVLNPCSPSDWRKMTATIPSNENNWTTCEWYHFLRMLCLNKVINGRENCGKRHLCRSPLMRIYMHETLQFQLLMTDLIHRSGCTSAKLPSWLELTEWTRDIQLYILIGRADERTSILMTDEGPMTTLLYFREYWLLQLQPKLKMKWIMIRITSTTEVGCLTDCGQNTCTCSVQCQCCNSSSTRIRLSALLWFAAWTLPASKYPLWQRRDLLYTQVQGDRSHNVCCIKRESSSFGSEWSCCLLVH